MQLEKMISDFDNVMHVAESNGKFVFIDYDYLKEVVNFIKQQMPRVMTYNEVVAAGSSNEDEYRDDRMIFIWLEIRDGKMILVRPVYDSHPEWGNEYCDSILLDYLVYNFDERVLKKDYGKTWRCWTKCPTTEQRKAVKYDAT